MPHFDASTFETNVSGLFVAGGALAGMDTGNIFIENGRFHGEKIVEVIAAGSSLVVHRKCSEVLGRSQVLGHEPQSL